ncbi:MAG: hypothetical protein JO093_23865 [Acidobacteria bacterium]|nr:hypothetical protein [Acidobacteriota bacterium]MBV9188666.1 hypothetical protein [Acidobacteriota bacterium]
MSEMQGLHPASVSAPDGGSSHHDESVLKIVIEYGIELLVAFVMGAFFPRLLGAWFAEHGEKEIPWQVHVFVGVAVFAILCSFTEFLQRRILARKLQGVTRQIQMLEAILGFSDSRDPFARLNEITKNLTPTDRAEQSLWSLCRDEMRDLVRITRGARTDGGMRADYSLQFRTATWLCRLATYRFWATSTDPITTFQSENANYYWALAITASRIRSNGVRIVGDIPAMARVFIGSLESFASAIDDFPLVFLEMVRRHVLWTKYKDGTASLKFLAVDIAGINSTLFLDAVQLRDDDKVTDFMLVDNLLVYGREGHFARSMVILKLRVAKTAVKSYEETFPRIYHQAVDAIKLLSMLDGSAAPARLRKTNAARLEQLCRLIQQKASIEDDYGRHEALFTVANRDGAAFFGAVNTAIARTNGLIIAVDVADQKTGNFWRAWMERPAYVAFRDSCEHAVRRGAHVYRVFVLDEPPSDNDRKEAIAFMDEWLKRRINIAFVLRPKIAAIPYFKDKELDARYALDFLLVDVPGLTEIFDRNVALTEGDNVEGRFRYMVTGSRALGFELFGDERFSVEQLEWEKNLIPTQSLYQKVVYFSHLWKSDTTEQVKIANDVAEPAEELFERVRRM